MLIIYWNLQIGGIETLISRLAKTRHSNGMKTTILLTGAPHHSDPKLLLKTKKYADIFYSSDFFYGIPKLEMKMFLTGFIKKKSIAHIMKNVSQIHVANTFHTMLAYKIIRTMGLNIPLTVGFYHTDTYSWGGSKAPYNEKISRSFILNYLPKKNLLCYSEDTIKFYKRKGYNLDGANTFRIGVIDEKNSNLPPKQNVDITKICSVGRLVNFKSYNLFMIDVVSSLISKNYKIEYHIYGTGPFLNEIQNKINTKKMNDYIFLHGSIDYEDFNSIVSQYNLFIGSGTAIIQAASLGVISIVGIEYSQKPETYGFFSDVYQYEYNIDGLKIPKINIEQIITNNIKINDNENLRSKHIYASNEFSMEKFSLNIDSLKFNKMPKESFFINSFLYDISRIADKIHKTISKKHPKNRKK